MQKLSNKDEKEVTFMALFKCKMCGGELELHAHSTIAECPYCQSKQTVPALDDEKMARLYNRAIQYRLDNEFDKAYSVYETIVAEKEDEAEAYWGLVLSEYGVEYVEDPATKKRIPTCHRTLVKSVTSNENYKLAHRFAQGESRLMYEDEATELELLRSRILNASLKEAPYDVFICYKETDANGNRTEDSVLAEDIYNRLTQNGLRVFFSRISLEDKLGTNFEPCIYAALSSSKVMLMVTTNSDHCNAVWVKNEWKRYVDFMKIDTEKVLIPVYRDISPYTLPDEFAHLQAQDMAKLGSLQELVHVVIKLVGVQQNSSAKFGDKEVALLSELEKNLAKSKNRNVLLIRCIILIVSLLVVRLVVQKWLGEATFFEDAGVCRNLFQNVYIRSVPIPVIYLAQAYLGVLSCGALLNILFGLRSKCACAVYNGLFLAVSISLMTLHFFYIFPSGWMIAILLLTLSVALCSLYLSCNKKKVFFFVWGSVLALMIIVNIVLCSTMSRRETDRDESVNQVRIDVSVIRIESHRGVHKLYEDEIYDVLSYQFADNNKYYLIQDSYHNRFFVSDQDVEFLPMELEEMSICVTSEYINIRRTPSIQSDIIGRVCQDECYEVTAIYEDEVYIWYGIVTKDGRKGFVASYVVNPYVTEINS